MYELQAWTDQIAQEVQRKIGTSLIRVLGGRGDWEDDLGLLACFSRRSFKLDWGLLPLDHPRLPNKIEESRGMWGGAGAAALVLHPVVGEWELFFEAARWFAARMEKSGLKANVGKLRSLYCCRRFSLPWKNRCFWSWSCMKLLEVAHDIYFRSTFSNTVLGDDQTCIYIEPNHLQRAQCLRLWPSTVWLVHASKMARCSAGIHWKLKT